MRIRPLLVAAAVTTTMFAVATPALADENIEVTGTVAPAEVQPGDTFTITETVQNHAFFSVIGPTVIALSTPEGLASFADMISCSGQAGVTCATVDGPNGPVGYKAILPVAIGGHETHTVSFTLRVKPDAVSAVHTIQGQMWGSNYGVVPENIGTLTVVAEADVAVGLTATPKLGLLVPRIDMTVKVTNNGPGKLRSAEVKGAMTQGLQANAGSKCTGGAQPVCTFGELAPGASTTGTYSVPIGLLYIGLPFQFSATRTASSPNDPNSANNSAATSCRVVSLLLVSCG
ncbi:hypothetical protein JOF56_002624 [Kibdelosporangium banguiense]|uniref:DUF11 domain-containing protein n=1 Tax=Kibdelosporangium banguiense TaxID=1365924 RepID=A0ABS4TE15_9PSEU|nr:DUF11 domain-containing protein [Kibdelosporangium banguiense]MBP2322239.1 hypothetical protein [Kibdelosporangium banguiense]